MANISFTDYDRITDTVMYLSSNVKLNFTVSLAKKNKSNERMHMHFETEYNSKYLGTDVARSIKRSLTFYFVLEDKEDISNSFVIKPQDTIMMANVIDNQLFPQFFDSRKRVFKIVDNQMIIAEDLLNPVMYVQSNIKFLKFVPIVITYQDGLYKEGVRIYMNSNSEYFDLDIDRFFGFYYYITKVNMYTAAIGLINYVKIPPHGINVYSMSGLGGGANIPQDDWQDDQITRSTNVSSGSGGNFLSNLPRRK